MNKELIKKRFLKSKTTYHEEAMVQKHIAKKLTEKVFEHLPWHIHSLLELGCGSGFLTEQIKSKFIVDKFYLNDLIDTNSDIHSIMEGQQYSYFIGDAEELPFPDQLDLITAASTVQWFSDLELFINKSAQSLDQDGILLFNTFGPNNFSEIKNLLEQGLIYPELESIEKLLSNDFEILDASKERIISYFDSPLDVLHHLKLTGVTAASENFKWNKTTLNQFVEDYKKNYSVKDQVTLSWEVYYIVARKNNNIKNELFHHRH
jgi:malonyl-CoA O-methyltransferase